MNKKIPVLIAIILAIGITWYLGYLPIPEDISLLTEEEYELTVTTRGEGEIEINPDQEEYEDGEEVTLTANADEDWYFTEWTGDHEGTNEETTITMDKDKEVTARFREEIINHTLAINIEGQGTTNLEEGTHTYTEGERITISASSEENWYFKGWRGDHESESTSTRVNIDEDKEITAKFGEIEEYDEETREIVNIYINHLNKGEIEEIKNYLTEEAKGILNEMLEEDSQEIKERLKQAEIRKNEFIYGKTMGERTEIKISFTFSIPEEESETMEEKFILEKENGEWKIVEDPMMRMMTATF
ncbi:MAG: InlB B-repeat-containing protein [archaeon]